MKNYCYLMLALRSERFVNLVMVLVVMQDTELLILNAYTAKALVYKLNANVVIKLNQNKMCNFCKGLTPICPKCGGEDYYAYKSDEAYNGFQDVNKNKTKSKTK